MRNQQPLSATKKCGRKRVGVSFARSGEKSFLYVSSCRIIAFSNPTPPTASGGEPAADLRTLVGADHALAAETPDPPFPPVSLVGARRRKIFFHFLTSEGFYKWVKFILQLLLRGGSATLLDGQCHWIELQPRPLHRSSIASRAVQAWRAPWHGLTRAIPRWLVTHESA